MCYRGIVEDDRIYCRIVKKMNIYNNKLLVVEVKSKVGVEEFIYTKLSIERFLLAN